MADPDLHEDVNCLILDYLVCLAIEQTLSAADDIRDPVKAEEADWLVQSLKGESMSSDIKPPTPSSPVA
jgi:hypothetical protein